MKFKLKYSIILVVLVEQIDTSFKVTQFIRIPLEEQMETQMLKTRDKQADK